MLNHFMSQWLLCEQVTLDSAFKNVPLPHWFYQMLIKGETHKELHCSILLGSLNLTGISGISSAGLEHFLKYELS
jgi:hypothetical protein